MLYEQASKHRHLFAHVHIPRVVVAPRANEPLRDRLTTGRHQGSECGKHSPSHLLSHQHHFHSDLILNLAHTQLTVSHSLFTHPRPTTLTLLHSLTHSLTHSLILPLTHSSSHSPSPSATTSTTTPRSLSTSFSNTRRSLTPYPPRGYI